MPTAAGHYCLESIGGELDVMNEKLVIDVGMHNGDDTAYYLSRGYRVVAVDADPQMVAHAHSRFPSEVASGRLQLLNAGIAEQAGRATFWICDSHTKWNSFHRGIASRTGAAHHPVEVPTIRFAAVLERYGTPHFLKVDIEGNERIALSDLDSGQLPAYLAVEAECAEGWQSHSPQNAIETLAQLYELGYRDFRLVEQESYSVLSLPPTWGQTLDRWARHHLRQGQVTAIRGVFRLSTWLVMRDRLGRRCQWAFPYGASGPTPEEIVGGWVDRQTAETIYRHYHARHLAQATQRAPVLWCDWHARAPR